MNPGGLQTLHEQPLMAGQQLRMNSVASIRHQSRRDECDSTALYWWILVVAALKWAVSHTDAQRMTFISILKEFRVE